jgi:hypothetical protein
LLFAALLFELPYHSSFPLACNNFLRLGRTHLCRCHRKTARKVHSHILLHIRSKPDLDRWQPVFEVLETVFLSVEALNTLAADLFWILVARYESNRFEKGNVLNVVSIVISTSINSYFLWRLLRFHWRLARIL